MIKRCEVSVRLRDTAVTGRSFGAMSTLAAWFWTPSFPTAAAALLLSTRCFDFSAAFLQRKWEGLIGLHHKVQRLAALIYCTVLSRCWLYSSIKRRLLLLCWKIEKKTTSWRRTSRCCRSCQRLCGSDHCIWSRQSFPFCSVVSLWHTVVRSINLNVSPSAANSRLLFQVEQISFPPLRTVENDWL